LEACPLRASDNNSLDFVVNGFFMKLLKTNNRDIVNHCRMQFQFDLTSTLAQKRSNNFVNKYGSCDNIFCKYVQARSQAFQRGSYEGVWGTEVPQWGPEAKPRRRGSEAEPFFCKCVT